MKKIKGLTMAAMLMVTGTIAAQYKQFTLDDLLGGGSTYWNLQPENRYLQWWGNVAVETTPDEVKRLADGQILFTVKDLNEWAGETIARNGHRLSFPYPNEAFVLTNTAQKRFLLDFQRKALVWSQAIPEGAQNEDWNSQSRHLAYTERGNLYVLTSEGETIQVSQDGSTDGSEDVVYGQSVHRNEFGIEKGTFWSPDGQSLAFYRMDQSMVPSYPQVDISTRIAQPYTDHYPMAGEVSHQVKVGIFNVQKRQTVWLDLFGEPEDYHTNLSWSPDGKLLYVFELDRAQKHMRLFAYETATGKRQNNPIIEETHPKYVEPMHGLEFLPWDGSKAIMQTRRDNWNHLYLVDFSASVYPELQSAEGGGAVRDGCKVKCLTPGTYEVQKFIGFNEKQHSIFYLSNEGEPRRSLLYMLNLKSGKKKLLSAEDGVHNASLSSDGSQVIDRYSSPTIPRSIGIVNVVTGKVNNVLMAADPWQKQGYNIPEITSGSIKAADGQTDLFYRMVKPVGFDPAKKYPTVIYVYGGPHAHNIDARWHWGLRGWEAYMAQQGYLLFILDNRGSEWRGLAFEQSTYKHLGDIEMQDQMEGVKYLKGLPYVDDERLGVHGWSFGGFMTTNLMCTYPDVFKVGVAGGPVIDWKYYEVMYGERYMSTPQDNPEGYSGSSLLTKAGNLKGRLQIIFGYNDPTCVPQHTLSFIRACIDAKTQPDLFTYPGEGHNMRGTDQIHLHERITRYFEDNLK
ncbi:MAG: DPP IV N-terminal domain-containing protein [Bacteroidaceae bacterium]|nr:DPP IV N-terminal domain-containing protein [Bacteroidaceae bacterium]